jgi:hypothetical protein
MKRLSVLVVLQVVLTCLPILAQDWVHTTETDPMSDKTYSAFGLQGKGVNEDLTATFALFCADRKLQRAGLTVKGMTFHPDPNQYDPAADPFGFEAALGNFSPYKTNMQIRLGAKIDSEKFSTSRDMQTVIINRRELEKMIQVGGVVIQFADGFSTVHYLRFDGMSPTAQMVKECGIKAK